VTTGPLDPRLDPDRLRPGGPDEPAMPASAPARSTPPLDRSRDPDRYVPDAPPAPERGRAGEGSSLPDLLGASRTYQGERDTYSWAVGLLAVLAFLAFVALLFGSVLSP